MSKKEKKNAEAYRGPPSVHDTIADATVAAPVTELSNSSPAASPPSFFFPLFLSPPSSFFFKKKTKNKKTFFYPSWVPPILSKLRECFFLLPS